MLLGYFYYKTSFPQTPGKPSPSVTPSAMPLDITNSWKIYQNSQYGFEIKYPPNFFITENATVSASPLMPPKALVKISDDPQFENSETALVVNMNVFTANDEDPNRYLWPEQKDEFMESILNEIGYQSLQDKYGKQITSGFLGDPPWGYYRLRFPLSGPNSVVQFDIRIHASDDPTYGGHLEKHQLVKQILSTFKTFGEESKTTEVKDWKTFASNSFHFVFKYPDTKFKYLSVEEDSAKKLSLRLSPLDPAKEENLSLLVQDVQILVIAYPYSYDLDYYIDKEYPEVFQQPGVIKEKLIVAGLNGYKITLPPVGKEPIYTYLAIFKKGDNFYSFYESSKNSVSLEQNKTLFETIISTLEFTE